jgi:hypothetical protein
MFDLTQTLLVIVIVILTTIMTIIGIQFILILRDIRRLFLRFNGLIDRVEVTIASIAQPVAGISNLMEGLKQGVGVVEKLTSLLGRREKTTEVESYMEGHHGETY